MVALWMEGFFLCISWATCLSQIFQFNMFHLFDLIDLLFGELSTSKPKGTRCLVSAPLALSLGAFLALCTISSVRVCKAKERKITGFFLFFSNKQKDTFFLFSYKQEDFHFILKKQEDSFFLVSNKQNSHVNLQ